MDLLHKATKWAEHNRFLVLAMVVGLALSVWLLGCQPQTTSLLDPDQKVTATQLEREVILVQMGLDDQAAMLTSLESRYNSDVTAKNRQIEAAETDLEEQQKMRLELINLVAGIGTAVTQGGLSAPAAIGSVVQVLTLLAAGGLGIDTIRKSRVIGKLKNGGSK